MGSHGGLGDLQGLPEGGDLEHVEPGAQQQVGELDGLLLQLGRLGSRGGGDSGGHDSANVANKGGPDQGSRVLLRGRTEGRGVGGARNAGLDDREWWWRRWWCAVEAIRRFDGDGTGRACQRLPQIWRDAESKK